MAARVRDLAGARCETGYVPLNVRDVLPAHQFAPDPLAPLRDRVSAHYAEVFAPMVAASAARIAEVGRVSVALSIDALAPVREQQARMSEQALARIGAPHAFAEWERISESIASSVALKFPDFTAPVFASMALANLRTRVDTPALEFARPHLQRVQDAVEHAIGQWPATVTMPTAPVAAPQSVAAEIERLIASAPSILAVIVVIWLYATALRTYAASSLAEANRIAVDTAAEELVGIGVLILGAMGAGFTRRHRS